MTVGNLLAVYLLLVDGVPSIDDVRQDEGDEQADEGHGAQRELTGAGVDDGERRLQVGGGGIVGRSVPAGTEQQGQDGEHGADTGRPDAAVVVFRCDGLANTV